LKIKPFFVFMSFVIFPKQEFWVLF